jgi:YcaO-like protein with predicted kinase domain
MTTPRLMPGLTSPAPKSFRDGTHRLVPPEETVARVRPFMPAMGITRVANITGLDCIGLPVVMVCRPNARSLSVSQGKGLNLAAAKASGLMEEIESYHAERITLPLKLASWEDLRHTHRLVDVDRLPRVKNHPFHPHRLLLWIEGYDLLQQEPVWVPFETVSLDFTLPAPTGFGCFAANSNGLASGNHLLEAISHGLCEVVERDATTLAFLLDRAAQERARVDLDTIDDPGCREVLELFERAGVATAVWEFTSDVGIPCFQCSIVERTDDPLRALYSAGGAGCHPAREVALLRALTEAAQSRATVIAGARDDVFPGDYEHFRSPEILRRAREQVQAGGPATEEARSVPSASPHHLITSSPHQSHRRFQDAPTWTAETFDEDVAWEVERLRAVGIEQVVVVDLTKPEFDLPVVKVIVPGLEGILPEMSPSEYVPGARARALLAKKVRLRVRPIYASPSGPAQ